MKSFSRHDYGFSTLSALIVCFMIIMMISSVTLFLNNYLRLRKRMDCELSEKKSMLSFIHNAILKSLNDDIEKQEDTGDDEIWQYNDVISDCFYIKIYNNSALLNINLIEEKFVCSQWIKKYICDEFDAEGFMEDRNRGLFYSDEEYLRFFGSKYESRHFTLNTLVNINQCDSKVLEYLFRSFFNDENISDHLVSKISSMGNKTILTESEFRLLLGIYYDDFSEYFTYLPQVNVNFVDEDLLCSIFSYLQIPGWQRKLDYILKSRKDSPITEKKLRDIFSEKEYLKVFPWIGTRNYSYSIFLSGKHYDSRFDLMRNTVSNMFEIKGVSWECK